MSEQAGEVTRADFEKLTGLVARLGESIEELAKAKPAEQPAAAQQVQARELDVKDHAKALGLTVADVEALLEEKEFERFRVRQERLEREKAEAEQARLAEENGDDGEDGRSLGRRVVDGLGGIRNVQP